MPKTEATANAYCPAIAGRALVRNSRPSECASEEGIGVMGSVLAAANRGSHRAGSGIHFARSDILPLDPSAEKIASRRLKLDRMLPVGVAGIDALNTDAG